MRSAFLTAEADNLMLLRRVAQQCSLLSPQDVTIPPGSNVIVHSLNATEMNGCHGVAHGFDAKCGRYRIHFEDTGCTKLFRPANVMTLAMR
eukprot:1625459-Karenia_brevis.AAC.1